MTQSSYVSEDGDPWESWLDKWAIPALKEIDFFEIKEKE